ncbi:hypothetical protein Nepgr_009663 [Nepenthes gracilis]|uniref:Uncharacterized protein n=1 Tax=Nepenthes gracilis TaxID=150966 RepID=A0AAD3SAX8_NEPGR|nr:hypothetical protein Nepgr_009663 [Nepenthes gracilis]
MFRAVYTRRHNEAEKRVVEIAAANVGIPHLAEQEKTKDKIMMLQPSVRKATHLVHSRVTTKLGVSRQ